MKLFMFITAILTTLILQAQDPVISWQKCLGGSNIDDATSIQQTSDGGYIVAGNSYSEDGDVTGKHGIGGYWILKLDSLGNIMWQKCLGGTNSNWAQSIQQTSDGGYIVAGFSDSNDGDVSGNHGSSDAWIVKLNADGSIAWQKCLGGTHCDEAQYIQQTSDGGYIVAGTCESKDGDVTGRHLHNNSYYQDFWIVKLSSMGQIVWQKCLGGSGYESAYSIQQTVDGGYIVAGRSDSQDGDVTGNHQYGYNDYWIVKLSSIGSIVWQKCLGGADNDVAQSIQQTSDGGYIITGKAMSIDGDVTGNHGDNDYWIVKLNTTGSIVWQKSLGGSDAEGGSDADSESSIQQTSDGGYIVAGFSYSSDGDVLGNHGSVDAWIVKLSD